MHTGCFIGSMDNKQIEEHTGIGKVSDRSEDHVLAVGK